MDALLNLRQSADSEESCVQFLSRTEILVDICQNHLDEMRADDLPNLLDLAGDAHKLYCDSDAATFHYGMALALYCVIARKRMKKRRLRMLWERFLTTDTPEESAAFERKWIENNGAIEAREYGFAEKYRKLLAALCDAPVSPSSSKNYKDLLFAVEANGLGLPIPLPDCIITHMNNAGLRPCSDFDNAVLMDALWLSMRKELFAEYEAFYCDFPKLSAFAHYTRSFTQDDWRRRRDREYFHVVKARILDIEREHNAKYCMDIVKGIKEQPPGTQTEIHIGDHARIYTYRGILTRSLGSPRILECPDEIWGIGKEAFRNQARQHIIWPIGLRAIGEKAFATSGLAAAALPSTIGYIGERAFSECEQLDTLFHPGGMTQVTPRAFAESGLINSILPDSVAEIGAAAFCGCRKLKTFQLPRNLRVIEHNAFASTGLTEIEIPRQQTEVQDYAFSEDVVIHKKGGKQRGC
ncbi:MAG: leucine-rich repeat domain-containing protein [Clostridiales bacterium]|nr:leucine-rich repeat domain-containing protein [Clostridiales bacterium]